MNPQKYEEDSPAKSFNNPKIIINNVSWEEQKDYIDMNKINDMQNVRLGEGLTKRKYRSDYATQL